MLEYLKTPAGLKVLSGAMLLGYWFAEKYRQDNHEDKIREYEASLGVLRSLLIEKTLVHTLSVPTDIVGILANKAQANMNNLLSECGTLLEMYGATAEGEEANRRVIKRAQSYLYRYAGRLVVSKGGPAALLTPAEKDALQARSTRCAKFARACYQRALPMGVDLRGYNTAGLHRQLRRTNSRFYWATSSLFIAGSALAWFSS